MVRNIYNGRHETNYNPKHELFNGLYNELHPSSLYFVRIILGWFGLYEGVHGISSHTNIKRNPLINIYVYMDYVFVIVIC